MIPSKNIPTFLNRHIATAGEVKKSRLPSGESVYLFL